MTTIEIPEDVSKAAKVACDKVGVPAMGFPFVPSDAAMVAICAIMAERERCAHAISGLEASVAFTLSDTSRMLKKSDVENVCPHPNDCFYESDRARCGPCAVKASKLKGIEIDDTHSHLPEVCRLRREVRAAEGRVAELEAALVEARGRALEDASQLVDEMVDDDSFPLANRHRISDAIRSIKGNGE
ncbi:hypothetical protein G6K96_21790 [Agrobacterium vitis]|uniref:hypothetical protein n=1 Tax=Agrobacterium vitis TaxID=373 RepID=UPI001571F530|nr:hypothetical protein [Agrobacterium vitis]NTA34368.1 hypothetical protein [Agrobacterium vitis]